MKHNRRVFRVLALLLTLAMGISCFGGISLTASAAEPEATNSAAKIEQSGNTWTLENDVLSLKLSFADGSIRMESLYNKQADKEYLTPGADSYLFSYTYGEYIDGTLWTVADYKASGTAPSAGKNTVTLRSDDGSWSLGDVSITDITMTPEAGVKEVLGKQLSITLKNAANDFETRMVLGIYDDESGLHYQNFVKNTGNKKMVITQSDVIAFSFPGGPHYLHYVNAKTSSSDGAENSYWKTSTGGVDQRLARNLLCVYTAGDGFWVMPETNWRTQSGPQTYGAKNEGTQSFNEFASAWAEDGDNLNVKVSTNPEAVQLTLKTGEEFQYIGVNLTLFAGDVVDGKMAAEEHFRKRFQFRDTSTILNSNDWDYIGQRSYEYFEETIVPLAKAAGIEMVMIDDLWNVERDSLEAIGSLRSLQEISDLITDAGMMFGLWFSMNGGDHNNGRDLADPDSLDEKIAQIEQLAGQYNVSHQMIDLTEYWQNVEETDYSSPSDNVYRKNVLVNTALNEVVEKYPHYMVKMTNELDVYPTQGNRNTGLLHLINNGWIVQRGGGGADMLIGANGFGYLPLSALYFGGNLESDMGMYYHFLFSRNVKLNEDPGIHWTGDGITLAKTFNAWRHGERVDDLLDLTIRPTYMGEGWDSNNAEEWINDGAAKGPYSWMYVDDEGDRAMMIATAYQSTATTFTADTRWLDDSKNYMVADITLDSTGSFTYAYEGIYSGAELRENGFEIDLTEATTGGKAFWFEAVSDEDMQVIYANENVAEYDSRVIGDEMELTVTGEAGATATVIVGDSKNNTGRVVNLRIGDDGETTVTIPRAKLTPPAESEKDETIQAVRIEIEDMIDDGKTVLGEGVSIGGTGDDNASAGASGQYRFVNFNTAGTALQYKIDVPADGTYMLRAAFKAHNNEALSALCVNGEVVSETVDASTGYTLNKIFVQECKVKLNKGTNLIGFACMGKGAANGNSLPYVLRTDYIEYEAVIDADPTVITGASLKEGIETPDGVTLAAEGDSVKMTATAPASFMSVPITAEAAGEYGIQAIFTGTADGATLQAYLGNISLADPVELYSATGASVIYDLGSLTFAAGETKYIDLVIMGRNSANTTGYGATFDAIEITGAPVISLTQNGSVIGLGDTIDLSAIAQIGNTQPAYADDDKIEYAVVSESAFDVAEVVNGVLTANHPGTAVIRMTHRYATTATAEFTVTVTEGDLPEDVTNTMAAINQIGAISHTAACDEAISAAERLYNALNDSQKGQVENHYLLTAARIKYNSLATEREEAILAPVYYVEDLDYSVNSGSNVKKGTCPSGSHKIQFTADGEVYTHGIGFEPTDKQNGTVIMPIPAGMDTFYAKVGVDYAMSQNKDYDEGNTVTFSVDGVQMGKTEKILKNYKDGEWVDNTQVIEFQIPEGAKWLLIEQNCGSNRYCDHILLADAHFENAAAAEVQAIIDSITPAGVNISKFTQETGENIAKAEAGFYALTAAQQALLPGVEDTLAGYRITHSAFGLLDTDIGAGLTAEELANVDAVNRLIAAIPAKDQISKQDSDKVEAAKAAYNALSEKEQYCITSVVPLYMAEKWMENSTVTRLLGDVDASGNVDVADIMKLKALIMADKWSAEELTVGDMDGSKKLDVGDIMAIKNVIMSK